MVENPKIRRFAAILIVLATLVLLTATSPKRVPIYMLWFPFLVIGLATYALQHIFLSFLREGDIRRKEKAGAVLNALVLVSMLMLNTISRLSLQDIILLIVMLVVGHFYINRRYP